ncbi:hypothetical protein [Alkalilacustris brevis]|uniref:hypothetical protein n=1 Tax=Alkalilacustris brevis TaxID=2026338 RepID=UPI000E0CD516|nr:hypothetical protein [Alkalilacustris brevis]
MSFLARSLAGPMIWAVTFSVVYALHGAGCALGWDGVSAGPVSLHRAALVGSWALGLIAGAALLLRLPASGGVQSGLPRAGAWTGLVATLFTLFPVLVISSCDTARALAIFFVIPA